MKGLIEWFNSPIPRDRRRYLLVAGVALLAAWYGLGQVSAPAMDWLFWPAFALWALLVARLSRSVQRLPDQAESRLDERQVAVRNAIYHRCYQALMVLGGFTLLAAALLTGRVGPWWASLAESDISRALLNLLGGFILLLWFLPLAVTVWSEPDPVPPEGADLRAEA